MILPIAKISYLREACLECLGVNTRKTQFPFRLAATHNKVTYDIRVQQFIIKIISTDLNQYSYLKYIKYKTLLIKKWVNKITVQYMDATIIEKEETDQYEVFYVAIIVD